MKQAGQVGPGSEWGEYEAQLSYSRHVTGTTIQTDKQEPLIAVADLPAFLYLGISQGLGVIL